MTPERTKRGIFSSHLNKVNKNVGNYASNETYLS